MSQGLAASVHALPLSFRPIPMDQVMREMRWASQDVKVEILCTIGPFLSLAWLVAYMNAMAEGDALFIAVLRANY